MEQKMELTFDLLVTTMNKSESQILEMLSKMNISSNVIVRSQNADKDCLKQICLNGFKVTIVWATDNGLSKNRNELLKLSNADIFSISSGVLSSSDFA